VPLEGRYAGVEYLCEVQLNLQQMLQAKNEAHKPYEIIRSRLPKLCQGTAVDAGKLENCITERLNTSSLEGALAVLSSKSEGLFLYAHLLSEHLKNEAAAGKAFNVANLDDLPAGLGEVYDVNLRRAFPEGEDDPAWVIARPLIELISAAFEPITPGMAALLLKWDDTQLKRAIEAVSLLCPVRDGKFHVFHKTVVDYLTGEIAESSSLKVRSQHFHVVRRNGHDAFAQGFLDWLAAKDSDLEAPYWLEHGVKHLCHAEGQASKAAEVFSSDLELLKLRVDGGLLKCVGTDMLELRCVEGVDLTLATQMKSFVGKHRALLERNGGKAVAQLASQEPDESVVHRAVEKGELSQRRLKWRNKPQQADPCIVVYVYDAATEELVEELGGASGVTCVAVFEREGEGLIVAGYAEGTIKVCDSGESEPQIACPAKINTTWLSHRQSRAQSDERERSQRSHHKRCLQSSGRQDDCGWIR
jgi:hypothetical protein